MLESRIYALLENEVGKRLNFTFCLTRNASRPGSRSVVAGDYFRFAVRVRNDCGFRLTDLRGTVNPTDFTEFRMLTYDLPEIMPGQDVHVGETGARLISRPARDVFSNIANVSVAARLDLSGFKFQQWDKPLIHSAPHVAIAEPMAIHRDLGYHKQDSSRRRELDDQFWSAPSLPLSHKFNR